jgi:hypothetical protein
MHVFIGQHPAEHEIDTVDAAHRGDVAGFLGADTTPGSSERGRQARPYPRRDETKGSVDARDRGDSGERSVTAEDLVTTLAR